MIPLMSPFRSHHFGVDESYSNRQSGCESRSGQDVNEKPAIFDGKGSFPLSRLLPSPLTPPSLAETLILVSFISKASLNCAYRLPWRREQGPPFLSFHPPLSLPLPSLLSLTLAQSHAPPLITEQRRASSTTPAAAAAAAAAFFLFPRCTSFCLGTRHIVPR